jgi:hypothetical protein
LKIYLSARYSRHLELQTYAKHLESLGHEITSRWIQGNHEISGISRGNINHKDNERLAREDYYDLLIAEQVICFTELSESSYSRGGRHVEYGIALALNKRLIIIGHRENVFYFLPEIPFYETWNEALAYLKYKE